MNTSCRKDVRSVFLLLSLLAGCLLQASLALATPTIVSTVPVTNATGVSCTAPIIFTFSEAMNPSLTVAQFMDQGNFLTLTVAWRADHKVMTNTPTTPLGQNRMIVWMVSGISAAGGTLDDTVGWFTTAASGTGCDPTATMPSFTISKGWMYEQTSASLPVTNPSSPYCFLACTTLSCPEATNVNLKAPTGSTANMILSAIPGHLSLPSCFGTSNLCDSTYPYGDYIFKIQATNSTRQFTNNFPSTETQPPPPHLTNYLAAQSIDPTQPFVLGWDPLPAGQVTDCVYVEIYGGVFSTPNVGEPGMLNHTAKSVVIPVGTLQGNRQYSGCVSFYYYRLVTNGSSSIFLTYRSSTTEFNLQTGGGASSSLVLTNSGWTNGNTFVFELLCSSNQALVAEWNTNVTSNTWQVLCATNTANQRVRFVDPRAATNRSLFYRVRTSL